MRFIARFRFFLLASVLCLCVLLGRQAIVQTASAASEETLLREMLLRTVSVESEVLPGQLPPQAIDLPLPDQARIIGSITPVDSAAGNSYVYLDVPRSPQQVADFYQEQLLQAGWSDVTALSNRLSGFASTRMYTSNSFNSIFCKGTQDLYLWVRPLPNVQTATVLLHLYKTPDPSISLCSQLESAASDPNASVPVPALTALPDTYVRDRQSQSTGDGNSTGDWRENATIESSLTKQAIASHYISQLEQAGWQQRVTDTTDSTAWSFLTLQDEEGQGWLGFISIVPTGEPNIYATSISVLSTNFPRSDFLNN